MPCGQESTHTAFFRLGVIAHNLFALFRHLHFEGGMATASHRDCSLATLSGPGAAGAPCRCLGAEDSRCHSRLVCRYSPTLLRCRPRADRLIFATTPQTPLIVTPARGLAARFTPRRGPNRSQSIDNTQMKTQRPETIAEIGLRVRLAFISCVNMICGCRRVFFNIGAVG